uniref:Uncharacterized protein n=1 Tax=viral metagenome TaxID=1070528 RepID=A0A6C0HIT0_9ZZZZ
MEANIQHINVYDDGLIEMIVVCNSCKKQNVHTIAHASTKSNDKITIDFSKLGKRCCSNHGKPGKPDTMCCANYNLYQ